MATMKKVKADKTKTAANTAGKQRGKPFEKGKSGNPAGKKPGTKNRVTLAAEVLLDGESEKLTRKAIDLALEGDTTALRLCMERILSPRRDRPISLALPAIQSIKDATKAMGILTNAVSKGKITPLESQVLSSTIENYIKSIESSEFEQRLINLEEMVKKQ